MELPTNIRGKLPSPALRALDNVLEQLTPTMDRSPEHQQRVGSMIISCVTATVNEYCRFDAGANGPALPVDYLSQRLLDYSQDDRYALADEELAALGDMLGALSKRRSFTAPFLAFPSHA